MNIIFIKIILCSLFFCISVDSLEYEQATEPMLRSLCNYYKGGYAIPWHDGVSVFNMQIACMLANLVYSETDEAWQFVRNYDAFHQDMSHRTLPMYNYGAFCDTNITVNIIRCRAEGLKTSYVALSPNSPACVYRMWVRARSSNYPTPSLILEGESCQRPTVMMFENVVFVVPYHVQMEIDFCNMHTGGGSVANWIEFADIPAFVDLCYKVDVGRWQVELNDMRVQLRTALYNFDNVMTYSQRYIVQFSQYAPCPSRVEANVLKCHKPYLLNMPTTLVLAPNSPRCVHLVWINNVENTITIQDMYCGPDEAVRKRENAPLFVESVPSTSSTGSPGQGSGGTDFLLPAPGSGDGSDWSYF